MSEKEKIVFTNGCFDIIHPGHIDLLKQARALGTKLIVGINSDRSVREIKGASRPLLDQQSRAAVLSELRSVDEVRIFDENTPERLIREICPQVLVKGGDWQPRQIIGADFVIQNGGQVLSIPFKQNTSTSQIVEKIKAAENNHIVKIDNAEFSDVAENAFEEFLKDQTNIQKSTEIIAETLSSGQTIFISGIEDYQSGARKLTEDLKSCLKRVEILPTNKLDKNENFGRQGDLLIVIGGNEKMADELMNARQNGWKIIVLIGEKERKLAALSDVTIMLQAKSASELFWRQAVIIYFWCEAVKNS